ncbi:tRNA-Phe hydroxylase [Aureococcus anophagefferens]|nr:tRNA-Phe hydroxylase [Aureococcus anophagefferens]
MVTQEEDDLALPGDSPLWEFLGALVRAEAAILGDAADEERRRLGATPGPRGKAASLSPLSSLEAAARERPPAAGLLEHLHEALSRADAVGALVAAGDARTRDGVRPSLPASAPGGLRRRARGRVPARRGGAPPRRRRRVRARGRHAEALSSLVRRELKSLLNEAVAIVHGTGSVRFNFDDPAALLHRALRALHDGGGPAWATELRAARCAAGGPLAFEGEDEAKDVLSLAAAHGFALSVFTQSAVRAKLASGGFDRLEALAGRVRGADAPRRRTRSATAARGRRRRWRCGALLAARRGRASAAAAIAHLTALRDAAAAAAAAAGSKKKRKKRKRDKQKPLFDDLANSGVFLFPEIAAFPAEAD